MGLAILNLHFKPIVYYLAGALPETFLPQDPCETPAVPLDEEALFGGTETGAGFYYMGSLVAIFAGSLAMLGRRLLSRYSLHEIERCADRRRELDALERWKVELFLKSPTAMILIAQALDFCGLACMNSSSRYITTPFTVSIIVILLATAVLLMLL